MPDAPDPAPSPALLRDWLTNAQADQACAEYGLYRVSDFVWNGRNVEPRWRVRDDVRHRIIAGRSAPSLFDS